MYGEASGYQKTANDETLCIPMIETKTAVENLEAILDVPGIAGVYVGPSDLGFSYGMIPVLDRDEPEILKIYERSSRNPTSAASMSVSIPARPPMPPARSAWASPWSPMARTTRR